MALSRAPDATDARLREYWARRVPTIEAIGSNLYPDDERERVRWMQGMLRMLFGPGPYRFLRRDDAALVPAWAERGRGMHRAFIHGSEYAVRHPAPTKAQLRSDYIEAEPGRSWTLHLEERRAGEGDERVDAMLMDAGGAARFFYFAVHKEPGEHVNPEYPALGSVLRARAAREGLRDLAVVVHSLDAGARILIGISA